MYVTPAEWELAGMVTVLLLEVLGLLFVPLQLSISQPEAGDAPLKVMVSPDTYWPELHPVELDGLGVGWLPLPVCPSVRA